MNDNFTVSIFSAAANAVIPMKTVNIMRRNKQRRTGRTQAFVLRAFQSLVIIFFSSSNISPRNHEAAWAAVVPVMILLYSIFIIFHEIA